MKKFLSLFLFGSLLCLPTGIVGQGSLWGVTSIGGTQNQGTIFKTDLGGNNLTTQFHFERNVSEDGYDPKHNQLLEAWDGLLYGLTFAGGVNNDGIMFSLSPSTKEYIKLYDFYSSSDLNGKNPAGSLVQYSANGKLYGLTTRGGLNNLGVIFEYDLSTYTYTKKIDLSTITGGNPHGSLLEAQNGKFYGMTLTGGLHGKGTIFEWDASTNTIVVLHNFADVSGSSPYSSLVQASNGKLYGVTFAGGLNNQGVLFEYTISTSIYTKLYDFANGTGTKPKGSLFQASNGKLYGLTYEGGTYNGFVFFEWDITSFTYTSRFTPNTSTYKANGNSVLQSSNGLIYGLFGSECQYANGLFQFNLSTNLFSYLRSFSSFTQGSLLETSNQKIFFASTSYVAEWDKSNNTIPFTRLFGFSNSGLVANYGLTKGLNNKLYGVTQTGGENANGSIYEYDPETSIFTKKINLANTPTSKLTQFSNGQFYGIGGVKISSDPTCVYCDLSGGVRTPPGIYSIPRECGADSIYIPLGISFIYEWNSNTNTYSVVNNEAGGIYSGFTIGNNGKAYTVGNGQCGGSILEFNSNKKLVIKAEFFNSDASSVFAPMTNASNGKLYGVSVRGGTFNYGVLFEFDINSNSFQKKIDFDSINGKSAFGGLIDGKNGKLYGMTKEGGAFNKGVIYEYDIASNTLNKKIDFNGTNGAIPLGELTLGSNGLFYGVTSEGGNFDKGVLFEWNSTTNNLVIKQSFSGTDGSSPKYISLIEWNNSLPIVLTQNFVEDICSGSNATFSITTSNASYFNWQISTDNGANWSYLSDGGSYSGAFTEELIVSDVNSSMNGYRYRCIIGNINGTITSNIASINFLDKPKITTNIQDTEACIGNEATFTITASYANQYEWERRNPDAIWEYGSYNGSNTAVSYTDIQKSDFGSHLVYSRGGTTGRLYYYFNDYSNSSWPACCGIQLTSTNTTYNSLAVENESNLAYIAFSDASKSNRASVILVTNYNPAIYQNIGDVGFSDGAASYTNIALSPSGVPYVVYSDDAYGNAIVVKKYDSGLGSWITLGTEAFSDGAVAYTKIVIDKNGVPYVSYQDIANGNRATVKRYNELSGNWEDVGTTGFTNGSAAFIDIKIDFDNNPHIAFADGDQGDRASAMKFDGSTWNYSGSAGFSGGGTTSEISLELDYQNKPHVLFIDNTQPTLMRLDNSDNWVNVANQAFTSSSASHISLHMTPSGMAEVAFRDNSLGGRLSTMYSYEWENVQSSSSNTLTVSNVQESDEGAEYRCLVIGQCDMDLSNSAFINILKNTPVISTHPSDANSCPGGSAFFSSNVSNYASLQWQKKFEDWMNVGSFGISEDKGYSPKVSQDNDGNLYVVYRDLKYQYSLSVLKYDGDSWSYVGSPGFTIGATFDYEIKVSPNNQVYIAYSDPLYNGKISVAIFGGNEWQYIGEPGFSYGKCENITLEFDKYSIPVIAYSDPINGHRAYIHKLMGGIWHSIAPNLAGTYYLSMVIDYNNNVIIAYRNTSNYTTVRKLNGFNWEYVGSPNFGGLNPLFHTLTVDKNNELILSFTDNENNGRVSVWWYSNSSQSWAPLGQASSGAAYNNSITVDSKNDIYVLYSDQNIGYRGMLSKLEGNSWRVIGVNPFSEGATYGSDILIDKFDNPTIAYSDEGAALNSKINVKQFLEWQNIPNKTSLTLNLTNIPESDDSTFYRISALSNCSLTYSNAAVLRIFTTNPNITQHPWNQSTCEGGNATYSVLANNANQYQWQKRLADAVWTTVGNVGFTKDGFVNPSVAIDNNGKAYVAFSDFEHDMEATVLWFDGSEWLPLGSSGFTDREAIDLDIKLRGDSIVFVAFSNPEFEDKLSVMYYTSTDGWNYLGDKTISDGQAQYPYLALDNSGVLHVAFKDNARDGKMSVLKYSGNSWVAVGSLGFTDGYINYPNLAFDNFNQPFVAYRDGSAGDRASVMNFDSISWKPFATAITSGVADYVSMAIDNQNKIYVAYQDRANDDRASVMVYEWGSWNMLGWAPASEGAAESTTVKVDNTGVVFLSYIDYETMEVAVKKFQNWQWMAAGVQSISNGPASNLVMDVDVNGTVYVFYEDWNEGFLGTVKSYDGWENISGATSSTLTLTNVQATDNNSEYRCIVSNTCGNSIKSTSAFLYIQPNNPVSENPTDAEVCTNQWTGFSVQFSQWPWSMQWQVDRNDGNGFVNLFDDASHIGTSWSYLSVLATSSMNDYKYRLMSTGSCGTSYSEFATLRVYDTPPAQPTAISGSAYMCNDTYATYSIAPVANATSYNWSVPDNVYIISGQGTTEIEVYMGKVQGAIFVSSVNSCGYSISQSINVTAMCTKLQHIYCGTTVVSLDDALYAESISGAMNYEWELVSQSNGAVLSLVRDRALVRLSMFSGIEYGTTYDVRVRAYFNGQWTNWGPSCEISTPAASYPTTRVRDKHCGTTLSTMTDAIYCYKVDLATNYWWEFTSQSDGTVINYNRGSDVLLIRPSAAGLSPGVTYSIRIRPYVDGAWRNYGASCLVTMPGTATRTANEENQSTISSIENDTDEDGASNMFITIFPNPTNKLTPVSLVVNGLNTVDKTVTIEVTDMVGKKIYEKKADNNGGYVREYIRFDNDIASGSYFINIKTSTEVIVRKIVVL
jgi:uncharacterized repeat protein (TIGR03803 family)